MIAVHYTAKDHDALQLVRTTIAAIRRDTESRTGMPSSDWQFALTVSRESGLTMRRIERLVKLGVLLSQPSDGHGPSIRLIG